MNQRNDRFVIYKINAIYRIEIGDKVRKMNSYRLRTLPLDMLHVLDEGRQRRLKVAPLEGQARKIEALEILEDQEFVSKCLEPVDLRCDCCEINFCGATKLRAMLDHIQTQQHFTKFRSRMLEDPVGSCEYTDRTFLFCCPLCPHF